MRIQNLSHSGAPFLGVVPKVYIFDYIFLVKIVHPFSNIEKRKYTVMLSRYKQNDKIKIAKIIFLFVEFKAFIVTEILVWKDQLKNVEDGFLELENHLPSSPPKKKSKRAKEQKKTENKGMAEFAAELQIDCFKKVIIINQNCLDCFGNYLHIFGFLVTFLGIPLSIIYLQKFVRTSNLLIQ